MDQLQNRQRKIAAYLSQKNDYAFYVGVQISGSLKWTQVYELDGTELVGLDFQRYPLADLNSWMVVYPRTGEIVDGEQIFGPLPPGVTGDLQKSVLDIPAFTL